MSPLLKALFANEQRLEEREREGGKEREREVRGEKRKREEKGGGKRKREEKEGEEKEPDLFFEFKNDVEYCLRFPNGILFYLFF